MLSWYLDSSAILKLILIEKESRALVSFLKEPVTTSAISRVEVIRTLRRADPEKIEVGLQILYKIRIVPINQTTLLMAENLPANITLRTLDALHVASAYMLGQTIHGLVTYDKQMAVNAKKLGIEVVSPGAR
ncbi:MAG: PIN domain-containing protein [Streptomycetaceae bacterium]|nr:MAG: PIN domain-containing protein [Streptomycetaceae bacterium]